MDSEIKRKSKWDTPTGVCEFDEHGSSLEAASAAAAKINAMLIAKGKLKLPTVTVPAAQQPPKQKIHQTKTKEESIIAEVEINDVPLQCRNMLTRGSTQEEISKMSGAAVSTRGRFMSYADRAKNNMGERPLYLCVQGQNKECIDRAVQRIRSIIDESMSKPKGKGRGKSRLFGQMEPTQTSNQQPCLGTPFVSQQPLPLMSIQSSAPNSTQTIGPYIQEKVFVGLEHAHPSFNVREKILGPGGSFLQHIRTETGANIYIRGRGSGHLEPTSGREAFENLYIFITHPKLEGVLAAKKLCENLIQTIHTEYSKHQSQTRTNPTPLVGIIVPASVAHQGQAILGHSSTTALIQQPNTGTIQRIQVPAVIQQTPGGSQPQPQTHTVAINQGRTSHSASPAQQVGLAQVGNTVVGVVNSALGASIAQGNIQHAARSQSGQLVYTCTVPASAGVVYPHLQQVVPQQAAHQSHAQQQAVLVQQVSIPRSVAAVPTQATPQGVIQQQVQQHLQQQQQQQQQILNAQLSAAQTVGLIHTQAASSQHSVLQGSSTVVVQQQAQQQQQIHQQIHQQIQQQKMQQEQQQQVHQIRHQQHLQQIQQQQQSDASQVALRGPSLSSISTVHPEQRQKRRFREEAPDNDCKEDLLGYQHGPPHLTNVGTDSIPGIVQAISRSSQPPPHQEGPSHPQGMSAADDTILMPPPPAAPSMVEPPPRQLDKHLMPPPLHPPAKGHRIALMDEPPQKRNKGLVSYDAGDSDEDEDIIRSPQAHTHFQPNSPQLPVIFHRSPPSPTVHHSSPDKIEYAFQTSSGPSLRQPPPQRIIVSQGNQANPQRIAISVEQAERIGISVSQGVAMSPPRGEPIAVAQGIPQKAPPSVQHSLLGEGPQYNRQQPFWMSPH